MSFLFWRFSWVLVLLGFFGGGVSWLLVLILLGLFLAGESVLVCGSFVDVFLIFQICYDL